MTSWSLVWGVNIFRDSIEGNLRGVVRRRMSRPRARYDIAKHFVAAVAVWHLPEVRFQERDGLEPEPDYPDTR